MGKFAIEITTKKGKVYLIEYSDDKKTVTGIKGDTSDFRLNIYNQAYHFFNPVTTSLEYAALSTLDYDTAIMLVSDEDFSRSVKKVKYTKEIEMPRETEAEKLLIKY